jgi:aminopeptidase N
MVIMDGGPEQGLIIHEGSHQYVHGIFGNNEWREGWLDEGMASFLSRWFRADMGDEDPYSGFMIGIGGYIGQNGLVAPISTESKDFPDFRTYGLMTYSVPEAVLYSLRKLIGDDAFRRGMRDYYDRKAIEHVTEEDLRASLEWAAGRDLDWFFHEWFHTTGTLDYAVGDIDQSRLAEGWRTRVDVLREGENWMPITVRIGDEERQLEGRGEVQSVEVETTERPERIVLDPEVVLLDTDRSNNEAVIEEAAGG